MIKSSGSRKCMKFMKPLIASRLGERKTSSPKTIGICLQYYVAGKAEPKFELIDTPFFGQSYPMEPVGIDVDGTDLNPFISHFCR